MEYYSNVLCFNLWEHEAYVFNSTVTGIKFVIRNNLFTFLSFIRFLDCLSFFCVDGRDVH